jgi:hypothetical protein
MLKISGEVTDKNNNIQCKVSTYISTNITACPFITAVALYVLLQPGLTLEGEEVALWLLT